MVILPLILAYLVKGNSRIMGFFRTAFYMPVVMSAVVVGMIWTNLLDSAGLVNSVLKALKIVSSRFHSSPIDGACSSARCS